GGVRAVITIGIDLESSEAAIALASRYPMVHATVGIHPHDVGNIDMSELEDIESLIERGAGKIVGYGEIGLDYVKRYCDIDIQKKLFAAQLSIAKNHNLPVVIHDREAHDDILRILKDHGPFDNGGVMHCFSGDLEFARKTMELGFHISIPGIVTFKNATALHEVATKIPLEAMIIETDGPFLAPEPFRGKRNEPLYVLYTADCIAGLRTIGLEELAEKTTANALKLFGFSL
ncbi:MAG TPA: TatD family hydrolase, partial [Desulfopila sp.]|nr:TatD family hydrolase [Desulfopila sp.]